MTAKRPDTMSPPDSGKGFPGLTRVRQAELIGTGTVRYQIPGETCPDCDGKQWEPGDGWCFNALHPTYINQKVA